MSKKQRDRAGDPTTHTYLNNSLASVVSESANIDKLVTHILSGKSSGIKTGFAHKGPEEDVTDHDVKVLHVTNELIKSAVDLVNNGVDASELTALLRKYPMPSAE